MRIVIVEWSDSGFMLGTWHDRIHLDSLPELFPIVSIGILVKENDEAIELVPYWSDTQFSGAQSIPKATIKRMRQLKI